MTKAKWQKGDHSIGVFNAVSLILAGESLWIGHRVWNAAAAKNLPLAKIEHAAGRGYIFTLKPRTDK